MTKSYIKKRFLPNSFIDVKMKEAKSGDKRGIVLLSIIALILLPIAIEELAISKTEEINQNIIHEEESYISKDELFKWLDISIDGVNGVFSEKGGKVTVINKMKLAEMYDNEKISINKIENLGEDKYSLEIIKE